MTTRTALVGLAFATALSAYGLVATKAPAKTMPAATPFANNSGNVPPKSVYSGRLFALSFPSAAANAKMKMKMKQMRHAANAKKPWTMKLGGNPITPQTAMAYVLALKAYVTPAARQLVLNYGSWNPQQYGWYNQPWIYPDREAIHGMYAANTFTPNYFPKSGLKTTMTTFAVEYYDPVAAQTLYGVWGPTALNPSITGTTTQFAQGAVIVKAAVTTATADQWAPMQGAAVWPIYTSPNGPATPSLIQAPFMQFDIIVKDSSAAPQTGWVYSTLVYDKDAPGNDAWDKMVPLGAMWGNDPGVVGPAGLKQNWINPNAPVYSTETLGYGGRLSGPNDGAVNPVQINGRYMAMVADSSCMSCHSVAEWPENSFLLPSTTNPGPTFVTDPPKSTDPNAVQYLVSPAVGSAAWNTWFQSRPGDVPADKGTQAFDYDMEFAFKALATWQCGGPCPQSAGAALKATRGRFGVRIGGPGGSYRGTKITPAPRKTP